MGRRRAMRSLPIIPRGEAVIPRHAGLDGPASTGPIDHYRRHALLSDRQCTALNRMVDLRATSLLGYNHLLAMVPRAGRVVVGRVIGGEFPAEAGYLDALRAGATVLADRMGLPR